jgi:hypothetical protein
LVKSRLPSGTKPKQVAARLFQWPNATWYGLDWASLTVYDVIDGAFKSS